MNTKLIFGILSSVMGTLTIFPQCYKTVKTGKADDISFWSIFFFMLCDISWIIYGCLDNYDLPIIITDTLLLIHHSYLILMICKPKKEIYLDSPTCP